MNLLVCEPYFALFENNHTVINEHSIIEFEIRKILRQENLVLGIDKAIAVFFSVAREHTAASFDGSRFAAAPAGRKTCTSAQQLRNLSTYFIVLSEYRIR